MAEQLISVDGRQYRVDDLSEDARGRIASVRACDQRIQQLQQDLAIAQTARAVYANALRTALPEPVDTAGEDAAADAPAGDGAG